MPRAEADDRYRASGRDAFGGGGGPAGLTREHAEKGGLIDGVREVAGFDAEDDLFCGNAVALGKPPRFPVWRQDLAQERDGFSHATEQTIAREKDLHDGDGVEVGGLHCLSGAKEVDVSGLAGEDSLIGCKEVSAHCAAAVRPVTVVPRTDCICLSANVCASG